MPHGPVANVDKPGGTGAWARCKWSTARSEIIYSPVEDGPRSGKYGSHLGRI